MRPPCLCKGHVRRHGCADDIALRIFGLERPSDRPFVADWWRGNGVLLVGSNT